LRLKTGVSRQVLSSEGSSLKAFGSDTEKARSRSLSLVTGIHRSPLSAERRDARDEMSATMDHSIASEPVDRLSHRKL
jgi:hypothetical protein